MDLNNYIPKGELYGFPKEIIEKMIEYQVAQGGEEDVSVFEVLKTAGRDKINGFVWHDTPEGGGFWYRVIRNENFSLFFEKYPERKYKPWITKIRKDGEKDYFYEEDSEEPKPVQYQIGIDTFSRMEANSTKEECLAFARGNIDKYNWRKKGQDKEDLEKIIAYAQWALKIIEKL